MTAPSRSRPKGEVKRFDVTLEGLRQLHHRVEDHQLEPDDWPLLGALVSKQIARAEARQERMIAKIAAAAAQQAEGQVSGADDSVEAGEPTGSASSSGADANAIHSREAEPATEKGGDGSSADGGGEAEPSASKKKPKGHGRNGASAFTRAKHLFYALAAGVIGATCEVCGFGPVSPYREKVVIRIVGQPLFGAEAHHFEQARCRNCGHLVRADGPAEIPQGLGSEYVRYDWSACAMLIVMHSLLRRGTIQAPRVAAPGLGRADARRESVEGRRRE